MKSRFYYEGLHRKIVSKIRDDLNARPNFLSPHTAGSPRAVGDALESLISERFPKFLGRWCKEYSSDFSRRAMADMAFLDKDGFYSVIDVKTHRVDAQFSMPALTSVERLTRFYESNTNYFSLIMIKYSVRGTRINVSDVLFEPIEFLDWKCLTVGALGWGQIQISNANTIMVRKAFSRKKWMLQFCDVMEEFYPREISKIQERVDRFNAIRRYWKKQNDIWV